MIEYKVYAIKYTYHTLIQLNTIEYKVKGLKSIILHMFGRNFLYGEPFSCNAYIRTHSWHTLINNNTINTGCMVYMTWVTG